LIKLFVRVNKRSISN